MTELNYTKGEWRVHPTHKTDVYALKDGSHFIAECGNPHLPNGEDLANAQLIASAPDEDDCLRRFGEYIAVNYDDNNKPFYYIDQEWFDMRTKALDKAEGKE